MLNPDPSPETRFHKGRAKTGGRQRGTPNKPKTVKVAWREFTDGFGDEMVAFAKHVLFGLPDVVGSPGPLFRDRSSALGQPDAGRRDPGPREPEEPGPVGLTGFLRAVSLPLPD